MLATVLAPSRWEMGKVVVPDSPALINQVLSLSLARVQRPTLILATELLPVSRSDAVVP